MRTSEFASKRGNFSILSIFSVLLIVLTLLSCEKNPARSGKQVSIALSDAPGDYQHVYVDVQKVEVKIDLEDDISDDNTDADSEDDDDENDLDSDDQSKSRDEYGEWQTVDFTPAVIDLLTLQNGMETIIGTTFLTHEVRKVRITLGENNSIVDKDGASHTLVLSNPTKNFLYVKIHDEDKDEDKATDGQIIRIDFDVANSIYFQNSKYVLKPVLRPFSHSKYGEIEGKVLPANIGASVKIEDSQAFSTTNQVTSEGKFRFNGLNVNSTYKITIEAAGYATQTIEGVKVDLDRELILSDITLINN